MKPLLPLLALAALLLCAGCRETPPPYVSWHSSPRAAEPGRVAVLAFWSNDGVGRSAALVADAAAAALRELGLHEVVLVGAERRRALLPDDVLLANHLGADHLLRLRDALHCDAVLLGRVEQFDGYDPIAIGLSMHLISCADGEKLWEATGHLDGGRSEVQEDLRRWWEQSAGRGSTGPAGWRGVLSSPQAFARYATERLLWTLPPRDEDGRRIP